MVNITRFQLYKKHDSFLDCATYIKNCRPTNYFKFYDTINSHETFINFLQTELGLSCEIYSAFYYGPEFRNTEMGPVYIINNLTILGRDLDSYTTWSKLKKLMKET